MSKATGCLALSCGVLLLTHFCAPALSVSDYAVQVTAAVQTNPPQVTLSWIGDPAALDYFVYRKLRDDQTWGAGVELPGSATSYVDSNVVAGGSYEYAVFKDGTNYFAEGYICAGIQAPLTEDRGKIILLVDNTHAASLALELARLQQDLVGDGWTVLRHDVPRMAVDPANASPSVWAARSNEIASIKSFITADYNADPAHVKAVFLFGHVPVPYSGNLDPDGHADHKGAWPADVYYGTMQGGWTDWSVTSTGASDARNRNVPGDGKFDQTEVPSNVSLEVGRVDLANLPAFPPGERELLRQYLNKDHNFRHGLAAVERRGLIDDNFGVLQPSGEPFAVNGWRNFTPFFGTTNIVASSDWFGTLATNSYLWGYGCGSGTFTSAGGVGSTANFVTNDPRVVFTMLFGSRFGDWDSPDDLLRAGLATPTYTLSCAWAGRPYWYFHHMGLGETIGFSTRLCENGYYGNVESIGLYQVHVALMGDPTLRMHPVAPPSALLTVSNSSGGVVLSWKPSPDSVAGYHVYRALTAAGPFSRLTTNLLSGTAYADPIITSNVYMVRAVKLEQTPGGSYFNPSQGIFQNLDGSAGAPSISFLQPTNNALFTVPTNIQLLASTFDPANSITNVTFSANGAKLGSVPAPPYNLTWSNAPGGLYSLSAAAASAIGPPLNSGPVTVRVDNAGSPRLTIASLGGASYAVTGDEVLGRTYRIQFSEDLSSTNWQSLGSVTGNPSGTFQFLISPSASRRFYRSAYP